MEERRVLSQQVPKRYQTLKAEIFASGGLVSRLGEMRNAILNSGGKISKPKKQLQRDSCNAPLLLERIDGTLHSLLLSLMSSSCI